MYWYNANFRAQTNVALRLLRGVEALGGRATPADIGMLVKVTSLYSKLLASWTPFVVLCRS